MEEWQSRGIHQYSEVDETQLVWASWLPTPSVPSAASPNSCDCLLGVLHLMVSSPSLSLPDGLVVDQVRVLYECVTSCVRSTASSAKCPLCSQPATRIHSRYLRTVADLPSTGRQLALSLVVRKFFCRTSSCTQRIFAERFPNLVRPWARTTIGLCAALEVIGFATSGEAGARLATCLGMPTSHLSRLPSPICLS